MYTFAVCMYVHFKKNAKIQTTCVHIHGILFPSITKGGAPVGD